MLQTLALAVKVAHIEKGMLPWFGECPHDEFQMDVWPAAVVNRHVLGWNAARSANTAWVPA